MRRDERVGFVVTCFIFAGSTYADILFSLTPGEKGALRFGFGMSSEVLMRMAAMFALMLTPLAVKKYLTRPPV